jgi:hypothetical protein
MVPDLDPARPQTTTPEFIHTLVVRLEQAWQAAGSGAESVPLEPLLPPPGDPLRAAALTELIKTDVEIRCRRRLPAGLEPYLTQFPELGDTASVSPQLIHHEYTIRLRHGQAPAVDTYRQRFPERFAEFERLVGGSDPFGTHLPPQITTPLAPRPPVPPPVRPPAPPPKPAVAPPRMDADRALQEAGYRRLQRLGKGAFGEVWRAEAPGGVAAAVKIIYRSREQKLAEREHQALELIKELRHPFLLQTHAYWSLEDHLLIAMDLADGTLTERLKQCKEQGLPGIPAPDLLRIFREAAEAIDFLHRNNVLHRDIKPANVLLLEGHAKVADFGLAKLQDTAASATTLGTPNYMAPEVWQGKIHAAADQYALAVSYAEMRLGRLPFASAKDMVSAMTAHLWEQPDLTGLPESEQKVLLRAMAKTPQERYATCLEFVSALEEACAPLLPARAGTPGASPTQTAGLGETGGPGRATTLTAPPPAASRIFRTAVVGALLLVAAGLGLFAWQSRQRAVLPAPPPAEVDWLPEGVEKEGAAQVVAVGGKRLYDRVVRVKGELRVTFRLIPHERETDPATFYLMEDKVSNAQYRVAVADPAFQERLAEFRAKQPATIRDEWEKGGIAADRDVGTADGRLPVLRVTVTEAHCFARWLGGNLPAASQWDKASGRLDGAKAPFRDPDAPLAQGDVAVHRPAEGPMPVGTAPRDVSPYGCRDMAGNGKEWTRSMEDGGNLVPVPDPTEIMLVITRGREYFRPTPLFFIDRMAPEPYLDAKPGVGFRVALGLGQLQ